MGVYSPARLETSDTGRLRRNASRFLVVLCCVIGVVQLGCLPFSVVGVSAEEAPMCVETESKTTCTCAEPLPSRDAKTGAANLSQKRNSLEVMCKGNLKCAPDELKASTVCAAGTRDLTKCKDVKDGRDASCVYLHTLLAEAPTSIKWQAVSVQGKGTDQSKMLTLGPENIPYVDGQFVVGCMDSSASTTKCTVTVSVEARASATNGQTVRCAYGASSNPSHQTVTLSPSQNSITLVCGKEGVVLPTKVDHTFCSAESDAKEACDGEYKTIMPGFESTWWKADASGYSYTLSIPADKFPREPAKIVVGCQQKESSAGSRDSLYRDSGPTVCTVGVTIEASQATSVSMGVSGVSAFLAGASVNALLAYL
ncbi:SAG-related sequence [Besnoitia besnoiti]|uniref:SAG-related sequence n=1 Tax=Besnoitia besnoiti TaxID=94643 RepID=A0A2A9MIL6_BESBE|nr:SAG-related sequence [Besnoitia besnoiti]PFH36101.1 SAG-related sequence [Besnoitia besnoiti]